MRWLKTLLILTVSVLFLLCGWTFATLNTERVTLDLFFITLPEASLSLWMMASFVVGGIVGILVSSMIVMLLKVRLQSARRKLAATNKELDQLRTTALKRPA